MEVLTRPSLPTRSLSLLDGRTLFWPGSGPSPTLKQHEGSFGPRPPPSPPADMTSNNKFSLPPITDLLAYSSRHQSPRSEHANEDGQRMFDRSPQSYRSSQPERNAPSSRLPPTPPNTSQRHNDTDSHPPATMLPKHEIQQIDPALFNDSRQRRPQHHSPPVQRPRVDTSTYPTVSHSHTATTPYPHSAPGQSHSRYGELSPPTAVSTSSGPYYTAPQANTPHPMSAPALPAPRRLSSDLHSSSAHPTALPQAHEGSRHRPVLPQHRPQQPPARRSGFHPYNPPTHSQRRGSETSDTMPGMPPSPGRPAGSNAGRAVSGRNYTCQACYKEFSRPSSLKIHEHSHTGEKPFVCPRPGCGKSFSVRSNMKRHERGCHLGNGAMGPPHDHVQPH